MKKKGLVSAVLSVIILFATVACTAVEDVTAGDAAIVWTALSTDRYMQDEVLEEP